MNCCVLKNDELTVTLSSRGAEMISVKRGDCEYIWQGDPTYWKGQAPLLFPVCGRQTQGKYTYKGKTYELSNHGFVRFSDFRTVSATDHTAVFVLEANEETKKIYPFDFTLTVTYRLEGARLSTEMKLLNTGNEILPATMGGHPGFNVPPDGKGTFSDYVLEFGEACSPDEILMTDACYITGKRRAYPLIDGKILPLRHSLFDVDAVFLSRTSGSVTLRSEKTERFVTLYYPDMPYVGVWHAPRTEAPYVCIEPWCGLPAYDGVIEDISEKPDMFRLCPGTEKSVGFDIVFG